jgi:hypothetical protein
MEEARQGGHQDGRIVVRGHPDAFEGEDMECLYRERVGAFQR